MELMDTRKRKDKNTNGINGNMQAGKTRTPMGLMDTRQQKRQIHRQNQWIYARRKDKYTDGIDRNMRAGKTRTLMGSMETCERERQIHRWD